MVNQVNLLYAGALLFTYAVCIHGRNVNHLSPFKDDCSHWNSCLHMRPEYRRSFTQRNCECDFICTAFKDCCYDAKAIKKFPYYFRNRLDTCFRYGMYNEAIYVVGSCPPNYIASSFVKRFCEGRDDFRDPMLSTPVSHKRSHTTYRNRYCAFCNEVLPSELTPWKMYIRFDDFYPHLINAVFVNQDDFIFSHDFLKWGVYDDDIFRPLEIIFQKPDSVSDVRQCRFNLISSCPSSWEHEYVAEQCRSYLGEVHYKHQTYRNVDCARCNGVDVSQLTCNEHTRIARSAQPDPFLVLLYQGEYGGKHPKCRYGLTYDRFRKICRDLTSIN